jgi:rhodanese-related sulfurtransferase
VGDFAQHKLLKKTIFVKLPSIFLTQGEGKMKKMLLAVLFLFATTPSFAHEGHHHDYQMIHAEGIKAWLDSGKAVVILDARTKPYDDGKRLPGAKFLPYDVSELEIRKAIPTTDTPVVVYCSNEHCPASKFLADRLIDMGYHNVYKYPEGIADWVDHHYPVDQAK